MVAATKNPKCSAFSHGFLLTNYMSNDLYRLLESVKQVINAHAHVLRTGFKMITTNTETNTTAVQYIVILEKQHCISEPLTDIHNKITQWATARQVNVMHDTRSNLSKLKLGKVEANGILDKYMCPPVFTAGTARAEKGSCSNSSSSAPEHVSPLADFSSSAYEQSMLPWNGYLVYTTYWRTSMNRDVVGGGTKSVYHGNFAPVQVMCADLSKACALLGAVKEAATVAYVAKNSLWSDEWKTAAEDGVMRDDFTQLHFATFVKTHKAVTKKDCIAFIDNFNNVLPQGNLYANPSKLKPGWRLVTISPEGVVYPWPLVTDVLLPTRLLHCPKRFQVTNTVLREWMVEKRAQKDVVTTLTAPSSTAVTLYSSDTGGTTSHDGAQACRILTTVRNASTVQILREIKDDMKSYQNSHSDVLAQYAGVRQQTLRDIAEEQRTVKDLEQKLEMEVKKRNTYKSQVAQEMQALDDLADKLKSIRRKADDLKEQEKQIADTERQLRAKAADLQAVDQDFDKQKERLTELQTKLAEEIAENEKRCRLKRKLATDDDNRLLARERDIERRERILLQREHQIRNHDIDEVHGVLEDCHFDGEEFY